MKIWLVACRQSLMKIWLALCRQIFTKIWLVACRQSFMNIWFVLCRPDHHEGAACLVACRQIDMKIWLVLCRQSFILCRQSFMKIWLVLCRQSFMKVQPALRLASKKCSCAKCFWLGAPVNKCCQGSQYPVAGPRLDNLDGLFGLFDATDVGECLGKDCFQKTRTSRTNNKTMSAFAAKWEPTISALAWTLHNHIQQALLGHRTARVCSHDLCP